MTKNSTRKGLALGAIASLLFSGFTGTAAQANGIESLVSLAPSTGTEYAVIAGGSFKLTANNSSNANTGNLKFLVTDTSGLITSGDDTEGRTLSFGTASTASYTASGRVVSLISSSDVALAAGATFKLSGNLTLAGGTVLSTASGQIFTATASAGAKVAAFAQPTAVGSSNIAQDSISAAVTMTVLSEPRNTTLNTFVVNTGTRNVAKVLELNSPSDATRTVTVQAWVDQDDDGSIDSFENVSPARTVTFVKASELEVLTSMTVVPGDASLTAKVKTTPVLNGQQQIANDSNFLNVGFTRQDATNTVLYAPSAAGWNDTAKEFSATISLAVDGSTSVGRAATASGAADTQWTGLLQAAAYANAHAKAAVTSGSKTVTVTLAAGQQPHGLRVGDRVTFVNDAIAPLSSSRLAVTSVPASNSFVVASSTASDTAVTAGNAGYSVTTYDGNLSVVDRAFAGTYTAQAVINGVLAGAKATADAVAATSAAVEFATVGSANVQGTTSGTTAAVKKGALSVPVTVSVLDADDAGVTAGRPVVVSFTSTVTGVKVNDKTAAQTLSTDANGQVVLTVTSPTGALGDVVITAVAENGPSSTFTLTWTDQTYSLVDLAENDGSIDTTRAIVAGGSYNLDLAVMDQWFAVAPSAEYRLLVTGSGTVEGVKALTDGKATLAITDNGFQSAMATTINLQKVTSGVWATVARTVLTTNVNKNTNSVVLGANNSALYAGVTAKLSGAVAAAPIVNQDRRLTTAAQAKYSESPVVVSGKVQNAASSVGVAGAVVTLTASSSILFSNGSVDKIGSITVLTDANGEFSVKLYSTVAQKDSVVTVTALGKSSTTKVTFTGATSDGIGAKLEITAPASVAPASTLQVKAKLTDTFSNPVAAAVKVSYTGPGITFGALPTATDKDGELMFSALLGGGDTGNVVVTISYDQNGDGDYADAKDIVVSRTIAIVAPAAPAAPEVNAVIGTYNNRVAVRVENAKGAAVSVKIGARWFKYTSLNDNYLFSVRSAKGRTVAVAVYVNGSLENVQTITVK